MKARCINIGFLCTALGGAPMLRLLRAALGHEHRFDQPCGMSA